MGAASRGDALCILLTKIAAGRGSYIHPKIPHMPSVTTSSSPARVPESRKGMLKITEIFHSLQGEARDAVGAIGKAGRDLFGFAQC